MTGDFNYHFERDSTKAISNQRKHRINFELAATVLNDSLMLSVPDDEHGEAEERWLTMGQAENNKLNIKGSANLIFKINQKIQATTIKYWSNN